MATEKDQEKAEAPRTGYKVLGSKTQGVKLGRVIVEGSTSNPVRYADVGGVLELTDEEHERYSKSVKLKKVSEEQAERVAAAASSDNQPDTKEAQQRAQQTGQAPQVNPASNPKQTK